MVDKRTIGEIAGKKDFLEKKVPKNPKYKNVTSSLNTGYHSNHIEVKSDKYISKRKGELFSRIKPRTLCGLLKTETNGESIYALGGGQDYESEQGFNDNESVYSGYSNKTGVSGVSQLSSVTSPSEQIALADNSEFLLLDLREPEDYELFHIKEAINYPAPNLGRDKTIPELFKFKNKEGKLIIIYHVDERMGVTYANQMFEKGYDNIYLLTGGIEAFLEDAYEYVEGTKVPPPTKKEQKGKVVYKRSRHAGEPTEGDVIIPTKQLEKAEKDMKNITKTSGMTNVTNISRATAKTSQTQKTQATGTFDRAPRGLSPGSKAKF